MISMKTTENNDDRGRQFRIVICFRDHGSLRAFVCELFASLLRIGFFQEWIRTWIHNQTKINRGLYDK